MSQELPAIQLPAIQLQALHRKPSLTEQLASFHAAMLQRMTPEDAAVMLRSEQALADAAPGQLQAGDPAPDFTLPDQHGRAVRLADRLSVGPVVLLFVKGGWCPFCTLLLRAWQDVLPRLHDLGGDLLAVSPQPTPDCGGVAERDLLAYPILSDRGGAVASAYGVNWELPEAWRPLYLRLGHNLPAINGDGRWLAPLPSAFVIGMDRRIALAHADRVAARRLEPDAAIAAVRALGDRAA